jgi:dephospho-CoA kinase
MKVALTGGIATGKSTVSKMFAELGATILDADRVARDVVQPGTACWDKLKEFLGPGFFDLDGGLKRQKLRDCIIGDPECRSQVNAIMHPMIMAEMERQWAEAQRALPGMPVIFDIPLLFEANLDQGFDKIILVYTPPETQIQRLMNRDGLTRRQAKETLGMQLPIDSKKALSDIVIDNSLDLAHTYDQVLEVWEKIAVKEKPPQD